MSELKKVLILGSGPIVIGQAAEFDYAGTQACKALREEGVESVLVNSNPATIMTDREIADRIYIEPLTTEVVERIIVRERPQGILGTLGGQTGLNLLAALDEEGILERHGVRPLGTAISAIKVAEDRLLFRNFLERIGEPVLPSEAVENVPDALRAAAKIGYPVVVRPAYTLGGTGGGVVRNDAELEQIAALGIKASMVGQVLIEASLKGWKEVEYEVIRDSAGNVITVCNMENLDPLGVHTGDSIVVAPSQTLTDREYQQLRNSSLKIISELGIEGGCNVQFAARPRKDIGVEAEQPDDYYIIEVNPRVSRSSALASKATGYPIARVAAKIALGKTLDQIDNSVTARTTAAFEPALDYCVVKIPRWPFDKFPKADRTLGTQMKATGEVMAIERTFEAALQKAVRSLEQSAASLLWEPEEGVPEGELEPTDMRLWHMTALLRGGKTPEEVSRVTGVDPWFTHALQRIVALERQLLTEPMSRALMRAAKRMGFADSQIATLAGELPHQVRARRLEWGIRPVYKMVDTCAGEFEAVTPYFYSTYEQENEAPSLPQRKAVVIGSGPIRIGQGIEFDYSSVHAAKALRNLGMASIMVNSNPETVSTDFDSSERLYFEPLDEEAVLDILDNEAGGDAELAGALVQFGGQTAINISQRLGAVGIPILGSSSEVINNSSDRGIFERIASRNRIPIPPGGAVTTLPQALSVAENIGYPVLIRPSYVLGGRAMEIVHNGAELERYFAFAAQAAPGQVLLIDRYLQGVELEVDAVCDGEEVFIPGIMQHIERAGVHSGDSIAVYPSQDLPPEAIRLVEQYTAQIGKAFKIRGLMNIQYVIPDKPLDPSRDLEVYVLEVNPRASRTVPFISKVTDTPLVQIAVNAMQGRTIRQQGLHPGLHPSKDLVAIKAPVFSSSKLTGVDTYLGPEMKSTGEAMGIDLGMEGALRKALLAADMLLPPGGEVLLSIADKDKQEAEPLIRALAQNGCRIHATSGTAAIAAGMGVAAEVIEKRLSVEGPNVIDLIEGGTLAAVINTVTGDRRTLQDGFYIRRAAVERKIPCFTSLDTAAAVCRASFSSQAEYAVLRIEEYLAGGG